MIQIHVIPEEPFAGVTEDDLHAARNTCELLLFKCFGFHLTLHNLLERAEGNEGLADVAAQWVETVEDIHKLWPPFSRNVRFVIERANVGPDPRTTIILALKSRTLPSAHAAASLVGQWVLNTFSYIDVPTAIECLSLPAERQRMRDSLASFPQFDFEAIKSGLSIEWAHACDWLSRQPQAGDGYCVTMQQMAAIVNRSKKTIQRLYEDGELPPPIVEGGGGKQHEWDWHDVRPILEKRYKKKLPTVFPADRFVRS